ncbi:MAG: molybdopterin-binding protein [Nitrospirae bacterium]|nr:molybdopterin-binding protein [Nitrospirota bacterium]
MCNVQNEEKNRVGLKTIPVNEAIGMVLAHDITEIRKDEFKGRAFRKGHIIKEEDINHLLRLGKENLYVLEISPDEIHENDAAYAIANALAGDGVKLSGEPVEGRINLIAGKDGILKVDKDALLQFNMLGDVMCATLHNNSMVKAGEVIAGTRAIPLVVKTEVIQEAVRIAKSQGLGGKGQGVIEVKELRKSKAGIVITGNEVYHGKIKDAFAPVIKKKIEAFGGGIIGVYYAPDDESFIKARLRELIDAGADLLITTGGMSVDPDDVTRFAIRKLGATDMIYGSAVLPGAMFLVAYLEIVKSSKFRVQSLSNSKLITQNSERIPILGIPACGMYSKITIFDLILPRVLAGEKIGRKELAELGHGGLCMACEECRYPLCPFGKGA